MECEKLKFTGEIGLRVLQKLAALKKYPHPGWINVAVRTAIHDIPGIQYLPALVIPEEQWMEERKKVIKDYKATLLKRYEFMINQSVADDADNDN